MATDRTAPLDVLTRRREQVLDRWRDLLLGGYPEEAARFFRGERDGFRNPVGHAVTHATATIVDGLLQGQPPADVAGALEAIVRIRAVQQFSAGEAVSFVLLLKRAVRETLGVPPADEATWRALADVESRIDALALSAFEIYAGCRERIHEIRVREAQRRAAVLFERLAGSEHAAAPDGDRETEGVGA